MKFVLLMAGLFCTSVSFAGTMTCFTKEAPHDGKMQNQTPDPIAYTSTQAYLDIKGITDPQFEYIALGDDQSVWVMVKDLRSGIAAETSGPGSAGVTLNMGVSGDYSLHCQTK